MVKSKIVSKLGALALASFATAALLGLSPAKAESVNAESDFEQNYTQVEYIESNCDGYFDTGIGWTPNTEVKIKYQRMGVGRTGSILFGTDKDSGGGSFNSFWIVLNAEATYDRFMYRPNGYSDTVGKHAYSEYPTEIINAHYNPSSRDFTVNGDVVTTFPVISPGLVTRNLNLLGFASTGDFHSYARVYSLTLSRDGQDILNYVPCRRESDGLYGFYDTVTETFNEGSAETGKYFRGPADCHEDRVFADGVVRPLSEQFMRSNGGQAFDLGFKYESDMSIELDFERNDASRSGTVVLAAAGNKSFFFPAANTPNEVDRFMVRTGTTQHARVDIDYAVGQRTHVFLDGANKKITIDGVENNFPVPDGFASSTNLAVFGIVKSESETGKALYTSVSTIYSLKIWQGGELIFELQPAYDYGSLSSKAINKVDGEALSSLYVSRSQIEKGTEPTPNGLCYTKEDESVYYGNTADRNAITWFLAHLHLNTYNENLGYCISEGYFAEAKAIYDSLTDDQKGILNSVEYGTVAEGMARYHAWESANAQASVDASFLAGSSLNDSKGIAMIAAVIASAAAAFAALFVFKKRKASK